MLLLYEVRVMLLALVARYLRARAERSLARSASLEVASRQLAEMQPPRGDYDGKRHQAAIMRTFDALQAAEALALARMGAADRASARHERVSSRTGRTVPGLLGAAQAWVCAAAVSYKFPDWAHDLRELIVAYL